MALEDFALFRAIPHSLVFYPSDAVAVEHAMVLAANYNGIVYIRANRPDTPIIYENTEKFEIGDNKVVRQSENDKVTIVTAGVTLFEAFQAADALASEGINVRIVDLFSLKPINPKNLIESGLKTNGLILTVEDHYAEGGLGEAVRSAVSTQGFKIHQLAVFDVPRSGQPAELYDMFKIEKKAIIAKVKEMLA